MGLLDALQDDRFRRDVLQKLTDAVNRGGVAGTLGAPVDLLNMALRHSTPMAQAGALRDVDLPGGSEWIGQKMQDAGMVSGERNPWAEFLAGIASPGAAAKVGKGLYATESALGRELAKPGVVAGSPAAQYGKVGGDIAADAAVAKGRRAPKEKVDPRRLEAEAEASRKTAELHAQPAINVPEGPEFWPWRGTPGHYEVKYNKDKDKWFAAKAKSEDEKKLEKALKKAEEAVRSGAMPDLWNMAEMRPPIQQNATLPYATRPKDVPDWLSAQFGQKFQDEVKQHAVEAIQRNPDAAKFYFTGQLQDDYHRLLGKEAGQKEFEKLFDAIGATTSEAVPSQNWRMGTYQNVRRAQELPIEEISPPFPYGHQRFSGIHKSALQNIRERGVLPADINQKGATFSGNSSGITANPTLDERGSIGMGLVGKSGQPLSAPPPGTYEAVVDSFGPITRDLAQDPRIPADLRPHMTMPMNVQSAWWNNLMQEDPQTWMKIASDRANVTSHVTGIPARKIMDMIIKGQIPSLSVGGLGLGLGAGLFGGDEPMQ